MKTIEFCIVGSSPTTGLKYGSSTTQNIMRYSYPEEQAKILSWVEWECKQKNVPFAPLSNNAIVPEKYVEKAKESWDRPDWWLHWHDRVLEKVNEAFDRIASYINSKEKTQGFSKATISLLALQGQEAAEMEVMALNRLARLINKAKDSSADKNNALSESLANFINRLPSSVDVDAKVEKRFWGWIYQCEVCGGKQVIPFGGDIPPNVPPKGVTLWTWACHSPKGCASREYRHWIYSDLCPEIPDQTFI